ncbi:MAG: hypothetical protein JWL59_432 [Chthoniobacteraceae bacterium]|nr:hypothetical protein [Chthoniobacteraceae bacterium]
MGPAPKECKDLFEDLFKISSRLFGRSREG